ncbi:ComEC/Rec2 family competence protein [Streptomyces sp. SHP 1-2]|uniref:ComEC/Rec2 family competence protein n=1 Tax=Streptomyces sp. SHP 1-2 TaxID=2769489 RepID=UPI002237944C|nr:ComEC/Rec2 family competence protein [Streptomyces sp. SHP 1-2]MCW5248954.1 ComEC/Rec2 family competence protein [Streptomyces sp. SHP 1-2]
MHAASGHRLGAARPRQEAPADLRLVPPALAAWATAAVTTGLPSGWAVALVTGSAVLAGALLLTARRDRAHRRTAWGRPTRVAVAAVLLCVAAAAASAALHGADLRRGPLPGLARRAATVTAEVEVTADPRLTRPRVNGDRAVPPTVLIEADVREVTGPDGAAAVTRTPVLLLVDVGAVRPGAAAGGPVAPSWLGLLPTTRLRVTARTAPPLTRGDRIAAVLRVRARGAPEVTAGPSAPQRFAGRLRAGLREATAGLPGDARALLPGLVVGDTSRITPELDRAFKETDLAHVLAVSGANFTILLALLLGPPGLARHSERRGLAPRVGLPLRATALLGGLLAVGFVLVCRPDPSVLRAAACGSVALLALATGRRRSLIPALATAVLLLVLYDPWLARAYGFLLSVLATGALLTIAPGWSAALRRRRVPPRLAEALAATAAAQALCAPVVAVLSARVSLVGVPCNLLVEFAVAPATVLGFAALAAAPLAMLVAEALAWCASWPARWIAGVARAGAALPGSGVDWPGDWGGAALLALVIAVLLLTGRRLLRHPWWCVLCAVLLVLAVMRPPPLVRVLTGWPPPDWRLVMCDVGQGDALVLAAGGGAGVVVDAGPDPERVDRCLRSLGVTRVPLVVLTHFHADHVAGLPGVLRGRSVAAIETTALEQPPEQAESVRRQAAARRIPVRRAVAGERRRAGSLEWRVLWPGPEPPVPGEGPNDASVTLLVRTGGLRLLLLGDLEPPAQRRLLGSPGAAGAVGRVDVVKVAHHGSAHQDAGLMRTAAPRLALISCGAHNSYGHPAPGTLAALRALGAAVLRTDREGSVAVTGTATSLRVATEREAD